MSVDMSTDMSVDMSTDVSVERCTKYTWSKFLTGLQQVKKLATSLTSLNNKICFQQVYNDSNIQAHVYDYGLSKLYESGVCLFVNQKIMACMLITFPHYRQTSVKNPYIKRSPSIKRTLIKFPKSGALIYCKLDLY